MICPCIFHRNLEFQYIESGCYRTTVDDREYVFEKDQMVFIPYCLQHSADASDTKSILFIIPHTIMQDFTSFFRHRTLSVELKDGAFNRQYILPIMELILKAPAKLNNSLVAKGYINVIFGLLTQHYGYVKYENFSNPNFMLNLIQYIDQHSNENLTLERLAGQFGYNKFYLSGFSIKHWGRLSPITSIRSGYRNLSNNTGTAGRATLPTSPFSAALKVFRLFTGRSTACFP